MPFGVFYLNLFFQNWFFFWNILKYCFTSLNCLAYSNLEFYENSEIFWKYVKKTKCVIFLRFWSFGNLRWIFRIFLKKAAFKLVCILCVIVTWICTFHILQWLVFEKHPWNTAMEQFSVSVWFPDSWLLKVVSRTISFEKTSNFPFWLRTFRRYSKKLEFRNYVYELLFLESKITQQKHLATPRDRRKFIF
jgi:hypothetical protein